MKTKADYRWYNVNWFKRMAPIYDYIEFILGNLRKEVSKKVDKPYAKILDMACGTGNQSLAFAKEGFEVTGIDLSPDMLRYAKKKIKRPYKLKFICRDATKVFYKNSTFDISSISFGLHDMPEKIGIKILKEMKRVTKKKGKIIIVDYYTPKTGLSNFLGDKIVKIWETKNYDHFRKSGLDYYLKKTNLEQSSKESYLLGNIQIVVCKNIK